MADEGFLRRWARRKSESRLAEDGLPDEPAPASFHAPRPVAHDVQEPPAQPDAAARPLPSMDDVARLTPDADFSAFVARGVDPAVRRGALKKLFADPHFHAMDGLDVYIDDYTKPSPVSAAMLASLTHAKRVLQPLLEAEAEAEAPAQAEQDPTAAVPVLTADAAPAPDAPPADPAPDHTTPPEHETQATQ